MGYLGTWDVVLSLVVVVAEARGLDWTGLLDIQVLDVRGY